MADLSKACPRKRCALALAALVWLPTTVGAEPFAVIDSGGRTHLGYAHPPADAVTGIDDLRFLWRGRTAAFSEPGESDAQAAWLEASRVPFQVWLEGPLAERGIVGAEWVLGVLSSARSEAEALLGEVLEGPLVVVLYTEPTYARLHDERFSFPTGGFFDGRLHVAAPLDDLDVLRSRIRHEFSHAVFRGGAGGDRPFWLNEGRALRAQRGAGKAADLDREEHAWLRAQLLGGRWIPLAHLQEEFVGFSPGRASTAYLQSAFAAEWFEAHTAPPQRALFLRRMAEGMSVDRALSEATGFDIQGLDHRLRQELRPGTSPAAGPSGG